MFCHLLHTLWCECNMKSEAADRKKECQINFISNLFTFCQLKSQTHTVKYLLFSIVVSTCIIFKFLFKYLIFIKLIIDMYTCTCTIERQKESLVFCLTHIQVLHLWGHMNKWSLTHVRMLSNLVFDNMCLHSMHGQ